jgi:uncharacterized membrane protein
LVTRDLPDVWVWKEASIGTYSPKNAYEWLLKPQPTNNHSDWKWILLLHLPANIQFFGGKFYIILSLLKTSYTTVGSVTPTFVLDVQQRPKQYSIACLIALKNIVFGLLLVYTTSYRTRQLSCLTGVGQFIRLMAVLVSLLCG